MELERQGRADSRAERGNNISYPSTKIQMVAHSLRLSKADVMIPSVHQVILVENVMFRWNRTSSISRLGTNRLKRLTSCRRSIVSITKDRDDIDLPVPMNHTGPADSERIPRPVKIEICCEPLVSRSWSAVHTQVP